ncbi:MAG: Hsp20/alpha crystallin family protein [Candidatus Gastranaerophilales bacterium]|nr:Hsp20/alpha crystallin family protein [Candidatus Gastranaerophilales bacterium]
MKVNKRYLKIILSCFLAAFIGALTAFLLGNHFIKPKKIYANNFNPFYSTVFFKDFDKEFARINKEMRKLEKDMLKNAPIISINSSNSPFLSFINNKDECKITIDFKEQNFSEENIKTNFDKHRICLSGDFLTAKKSDKSNFKSTSSFYKSFYIEDELDLENISKIKENNKLIITIPKKHRV